MPRWQVSRNCNSAVHSRTPGSTEKENFTIIGAGVSESPNQFVHITQPHGFNIGGARQPQGCKNSQHSHEAVEAFVVHSGHWRLIFGANGGGGTLDIGPGDVMSVPTQMFRGFEKIDESTGFIWFVLGRDDPGKVTWAPAVLEAVADVGLKLAKVGRLIDTTSGDYELRDVELETAISQDAAAELLTPPLDPLRQCVSRAGTAPANPASPLAGEGVTEAGVIVPVATADGFAPGPIAGWWPHGFNLRELTLQSGAYVPLHSRAEAEVIFIQSGTLEVSWPGGSLFMGAGDTLWVCRYPCPARSATPRRCLAWRWWCGVRKIRRCRCLGKGGPVRHDKFSPILPLWGRWQPAGLTEGVS